MSQFNSNALTTQAKSFVTGDGTNWVEVPGNIYWGGSVSRQGLVFYLANIKGDPSVSDK